MVQQVTRIAFILLMFVYFRFLLIFFILYLVCCFNETLPEPNILYVTGEEDGENDGKDKKHKRSLTQRYFSDENALFKRHKGKVSNKDLAELEHKVYLLPGHLDFLFS